mmetsp:Transcript_45806/g.91366  ORF Transcript_45806/g.91366 Transcript_45806/m.91366 type:complete len:204 (-) Transcript_45806:982-1593(-)
MVYLVVVLSHDINDSDVGSKVNLAQVSQWIPMPPMGILPDVPLSAPAAMPCTGWFPVREIFLGRLINFSFIAPSLTTTAASVLCACPITIANISIPPHVVDSAINEMNTFCITLVQFRARGDEMLSGMLSCTLSCTSASCAATGYSNSASALAASTSVLRPRCSSKFRLFQLEAARMSSSFFLSIPACCSAVVSSRLRSLFSR